MVRIEMPICPSCSRHEKVKRIYYRNPENKYRFEPIGYLCTKCNFPFTDAIAWAYTHEAYEKSGKPWRMGFTSLLPLYHENTIAEDLEEVT